MISRNSVYRLAPRSNHLERLDERAVRIGRLPEWVEVYIAKEGSLSSQDISPDFKRQMVDYLHAQGAVPGDLALDITADINAHRYDEFFGTAYDEVRKLQAGGGDPIDTIRTKGAAADWNYQVDLFDSAEEQGVVPDNIRLAGAIDYTYWLGDHMGVCNVVDAIVLDWGKEVLDIEGAQTATKLYRFLKLREERSTMEDRLLLYKRALNRGEAEIVAGTVIERVARDEFQTALNVSALRTVAVEGNRVFNLIADYESSRGLFADTFGRPALVAPCERLIIAQAEIEGAMETSTSTSMSAKT